MTEVVRNSSLLQNNVDHHRSCLKCGTRNPAEVDFCLRCGGKLRGIKVSGKEKKKKVRLRCLKSQKTEVAYEGQRPVNFEINKIYCGDCLRIMEQMPDEFVDLIITSPPYNFGLDEYDRHTNTKSWENVFGSSRKFLPRAIES